VNEAGLRVYRFLFLQGRYPAANAKPAINESQYVQYLLDTAESVEDVIQQTNAVQIYALDFPTHFAVCDRNAKCVFIEALNGKLEIFSGAEAKVNAMTNTDYSKSLSLFEKCPSGDCSDITDNSDWRFVKAASQVRDFSGTDLVTGLFSIMGSVKQMGTRIASLWTLLSHRSSTKDEFFVQNSKFSRNLITLDLRKLDFSCKTPVQVALLHPADSSPVHLTDYTLEFQTELSEVVQKYLGVSLADMQKRIEYPQLHTRCLD
ncbi:MAG: linear amide C-N hydrolase, partial [Bdellovibrionota bacterium]